MTDVHDPVTEPIEIADDTFWVGRRDPGGIFFANPYLRIFRSDDRKRSVNLLIDPGSSSEFAAVQQKCSRLLGSVDRVQLIFLNHQDPDVGSVVGTLLARFMPKARVLCSEETWRLVRFFNIPKSRYVCTDPYVERGLRLGTGHSLRPVPSPFCHFAGATMLYDPATRVLFSGDLFGGVTAATASGLWGDESDWVGIRAFHQLYMPARAAIARVIEQVRALDPKPEIIAPQHGRLLRGPWIAECLSRLEQLPVGIDLLEQSATSEEELRAWNAVFQRLLETARVHLGATADSRLVDDTELQELLDVRADGIHVARMGKWVVERAVQILTHGEDASVANALRFEATFAAADLDLPAPAMDFVDEGEGAALSNVAQ
ncbi:MAG: hypothetical protein H6718_19955 [Polyangiaceae bacterium]|nr:hypothetical protein [Polyangiaceae bacterium]MCB9605514.1 hypothetical protein [Polyangiaceae bacterium]